MVVTKVKYEKLFPTGAYLNEKIGFEAEIEPHLNSLDNPTSAIEQLRQLAEQSHREKYPHLYTESGSPITIMEKEESVTNRLAQLIQDINSCTEIDQLNPFGVQIGLLAYESMAKSSPELKGAYDKKLQSLKNQ